ncbi:hypothetical protein [Gloeocapsopsis sp. IPPAS B-1203]|uniref:hypothetical protein n=1 Tax=Gloeocapsopsis sp. IPPAS B-1203 TaxID=2049454 RepID=UPI000C1948FB|nr:hypothetical protein [Gloeocapsopsis sp. IPPAS B-1203]PIG91988.1 hypothetical protein CSQ79_17410 [Gloeocapsopsis sp. IPPAS B-1203]
MLSFKIPWLSFTLLLLTYITFGWLLEAFNDPIAAWVVAIACIFFLSTLLASPWSQLKNDLGLLFKSDTRAFFVAVVGAFLTVLIISWFHIFAHGLVAVSSATLFRLDAQRAGWSEMQIFWILTAVSIVGLVIGGVAQTWIYWWL